MAWQEFAPVSLNADPILSGSYASLVGADPLSVADGDAGYVETYLESAAPGSDRRATFRLSPTPSGAFTRVKVAVEARGVEGFTGVVLAVKLAGRDDPVSLIFNQADVGTSYERHEVELDFDNLTAVFPWLTPDLIMAPSSYWILHNWTPVDTARTLNTTWLRVYAYGGPRPLRWRQRNDGLGGGSPRAARGVTSQQGSCRHRGYL